MSCLNKKDKEDYAVFCALMPNRPKFRRKVLGSVFWDVEFGFGRPEILYNGKSKRTRYSGLGLQDIPFEPLVICRSFYERWEDYVELSEEFRLYHNLYHDRHKEEFIFLNESGEEDIAARIIGAGDNFTVQVKTAYLRTFLAAKSMVLVRFHDHMRFSAMELADFSKGALVPVEQTGRDYCYKVTFNSIPGSTSKGWKTISLFQGKDVLPSQRELSLKDHALSGETENEGYVDFIIGIDENGKATQHTCNPDALSPPWGRSPGGPSFFTPVFFRREVLRKYYDQPSKYSVNGSHIMCARLWGMDFGQNRLGIVHVWLGDLGKYLPTNERLHWKAFNIPPEGGVSETTFRRDILAEFTEPDELTSVFKYEFMKFSELWKSKFGWDLFLPLRKDDEHAMKSLHVPTSEDPLEFDLQLLVLAKILPDSINKPELEKLTGRLEDERKLIDLLEKFVVSYFKVDESEFTRILEPLRIVQSLRSSGAAHRRGREYDRRIKRLGLADKSNIEFFKELLEELVGVFRWLQALF